MQIVARGIITLLVAAASIAVSPNALAQYPPPTGSVSSSAATLTPAINGQVDITCSVVDLAGAPVAGAPCTFTIVDEPGSDAAFASKSVTKVTGADGIGVAPLSVGSTPGPIYVSVQSGDFASQVIVLVQPQSAAMPVQIAPPSTGDGGLR